MQCRSWLEKLRLVAAVINDRATLEVDTVAACGVYLRWVGTCVVRCGEDAGDQSLDGAAIAVGLRSLPGVKIGYMDTILAVIN
jgi:hypothetical protein